jgi:hypothetical protein
MLTDLPQQALKFQPEPKKKTEPQPFSFMERDVAWMERKQQKIDAILEEEKKQREFTAKKV